MKNYLGIFIMFGWLLLLTGCAPKGNDSAGESNISLPNFIVIFTDDQGYGDLSCFGARHVST
ncbi:MAG: sulfatase family protein, partial [Cyclobacteriaceae bacterium]